MSQSPNFAARLRGRPTQRSRAMEADRTIQASLEFLVDAREWHAEDDRQAIDTEIQRLRKQRTTIAILYGRSN